MTSFPPLPTQSVPFVLYTRIFKTVKIIREAPSRIFSDLIFDLPSSGKKKPPFLRWILHADPLTTDRIMAYYEPIRDSKALSRGVKGENTEYLKPSLDNEWNRTKAEKCKLTKVDSGLATFYILTDSFVKVLLNGKKLKGLFILKPQDKGPIWVFSRSKSPGEKREKK